MFNKIKLYIYRLFCSLLKTNWERSDRIKVLLGVNDFFTEKIWGNLLENEQGKHGLNWDVQFYSRKIDLYRHFPTSDICFLYSLGPFLMQYLYKPRFLYFPMQGTDFLNNVEFPEGTIIEHPPASSAEAVAEYCLSMSIALTRNLYQANLNQHRRKWNQKNILEITFRPLSSMKIGVLGLGKIGSQIAKCFHKHGAEVIGCDEITNQEGINISRWFHVKNLKEFLGELDILIISLPLTERTRHIIDYEALMSMGRDSFLINISRGEVISENDLIQSLKKRVIKGAALDVFYNEPLSRRSPFYQLDNIIITPHIAGNINMFVDKIQKDFLEKAVDYSSNV